MAVNMSDVNSDEVSSCLANDCLNNLKCLLIDNSYYKYIRIDENGKLKCKDDHKALKDFVKKTLKLNGRWSAPSGHLKLFQEATGSIAIRFYTSSTSLLIQGEQGEVYTKLLIQKLRKNDGNGGPNGVVAEDGSCTPVNFEELLNACGVSVCEQSPEISTCDEGILIETIKDKDDKQVNCTDKKKLLNSVCELNVEAVAYPESSKVTDTESPDRDLHSESRFSNIDNEMRQAKEQSYFNNVNDRYYNKSEVMYELNSKFESYTESVNKKLDSLAEEISIIEDNEDNN